MKTTAYSEVLSTLLEESSEHVQVLLLHGMGGLGKSTLAKFAYMAARQTFGEGNYGYCELNGRRDDTQLVAALRSSLSQLKVSVDVNDVSLTNLHSRMIKQLASRQVPVLLLIDDVLDSNVAEGLLGEQGALAYLLPQG